MKKSQNAESFVGIIVGVFILSFVILGIANVLTYSISLTNEYEEANRLLILKQNLTNAVQKTDTSLLMENEIFYIHKNKASSEFEVIRPQECDACHFYRYIDELGNTIDDITSFEGNIYSQLFWVSNEDASFGEANQIIKASITKLRRR